MAHDVIWSNPIQSTMMNPFSTLESSPRLAMSLGARSLVRVLGALVALVLVRPIVHGSGPPF